MKIALCGRGGTGKTTLAAELSRRLALPMISEQVRVAARNLGIERIDTMDRDSRILLQGVALASQRHLEDFYHASGFVSDRSTYDYLGYYRELLGGPAVHTYAALAFQSKYDAIIVVTPYGGPREDDGFRFGDSFAQIEANVEAFILSRTLHVPRLILSAGTIPDRVADCMAFVERVR